MNPLRLFHRRLPMGRPAHFPLGVLCLTTAMLWAGAPAVFARFAADPVEDLRQALSESRRKDAARKAMLESDIDALTEVGDMVRALLLEEWSHKDLDATNIVDAEDEASKSIRRALRVKLADKIDSAIDRNARSTNPVIRLATATAIGNFELLARRETSQFIRERVSADKMWWGFGERASKIAPALALLARDEDSRVRRAAVYSLSLIDTDPNKAVPAIAQVLRSENVADRRVAAEALGSLINDLRQKLLGGTGRSGVYERALVAAELVPPAAGKGISDADAETRRLSVDAIRQTTQALKELMPRELAPQKDEKNPKPLTPERTEKARADLKKIPPLLRTLADQLPAVTSAARDKEAAVRLEVGRTLEALAFARREYLDYEKNLLKVGGDKLEGGKGQGRVTPGQPVALTGRAAGELATADAADQPLLNGLRKAVPTLALLTGDVNAEVRLAALSALDLLEEEAAPAVDALVKALADKNPFARWSAARILGKLDAAQAADRAVPKLVPLLGEDDLDVRIAGIQALGHFGPAAKSAVPALARAALEGDVEARVAVLKALASIGTDAKPAIPNLISALNDSDPRVRRATAETIGRFGPLAKDARTALQKLLEDAEPAVRLAASEAILRITK
jgi:HEAT repeat protein